MFLTLIGFTGVVTYEKCKIGLHGIVLILNIYCEKYPKIVFIFISNKITTSVLGACIVYSILEILFGRPNVFIYFSHIRKLF